MKEGIHTENTTDAVYGGTELDMVNNLSVINIIDQCKITLKNDEKIIAYSRRKSNIAAGASMMLFGSMAGIDLFRYLLKTNLAGTILSIVLSITIVFMGIRLVFHIKKQLVLVTNFRVILSKINCLGSYISSCTELTIREIKKATSFRRVSYHLKHKGMGMVLIKLISGKSVLLPTLYCGDIVTEAINREVKKWL